VEFVKFIGKRMSFDLLFIRDDVERQSWSILGTYWYLCLALAVLMFILIWYWPRFPRGLGSEPWKSGMAWRCVAIGLIFTGMRGGYGYKPLNPMQAYFNTQHEMGQLTLNTPFNLIKTRPNGNIERTRYFATDREAIQRLKHMTDLERPPLGVAKNWNVVVLIVESFASEFTGIANSYPGFTPFFDSLAKKGLYFKYGFANARRSIEGLPAVLCGLPSIMEEPIITSDFSSNRLDCLPKILAQQGYATYFLHGAHNGSMHFDSFSRLAGFENFIGLDEYPKTNPEDFDKYWGVLDEPMLQYAAHIMDQAKGPTLLSLFTLSSHHPYYIPPRYAGKFPKGDLEIHESIGYADYALQEFFKVASTKPWFNNTIFVITADHTQKSSHNEYLDLLGPYRVPILFYIPALEGKLTVQPERIVQHIDIMPSLLDLLGVTVSDRLLVGQSVFDLGKTGRAYNYTSYSYWYLDNKEFLDFGRPPAPLKTYTHTHTHNLISIPNTDPQFTDGVENLKAVVHYMNQGLVGNSLYTWRSSL
jgi:phosphoglycerol transferase MdoB-like AlkP superfamily enzyme